MARQNGLIGQLGRIAAAVEVLPEMLERLDTLDRHVSEMSAEVTRMRQGVDSLGTAVGDLNGGVDGLDDQFNGMRGEIRGLDGHLGEVKQLLGPLKGIAQIGKISDRIRGG